MVLKMVPRNLTILLSLLTTMMIREPSIRMSQLPKRPKLRRRKLQVVHHQNWQVSSQLLQLPKLVISTIYTMERLVTNLRMEPRKLNSEITLQIIMIA